MPDRGLRTVLLDQPPNHWPAEQHLEPFDGMQGCWRCMWPGCDQRPRYVTEHALVQSQSREHYRRAHQGVTYPEETA